MLDFPSVLFYFFSSLIVFAGVRIITASNPVLAALNLILLFFSCAGVWMILQAEFLALVLVLVYVGAVMVLVLFVVMMLDLEKSYLATQVKRSYSTAVIIAIVLILDLSVAIINGYNSPNYNLDGIDVSGEVGATHSLGIFLFQKHILSVEIAALILLTALIAAVSLTLRSKKESKNISASDQISVAKKNRLTIITDMNPRNFK